ncbi:hypothetical protein [Rhizobium mongolense]|uniref:Uncharacterized protein n=1 Tax=Rhizobium mongolense TaxID=57676 RepID=A0A7W6RKC4_9HYPH|nr:hypothetical protein [Rhizobium mongolense]MBB4274076.1 hypothetical protein [Rhizobium mongolense]
MASISKYWMWLERANLKIARGICYLILEKSDAITSRSSADMGLSRGYERTGFKLGSWTPRSSVLSSFRATLSVVAAVAIFRFKASVITTLQSCALAGMIWTLAR